MKLLSEGDEHRAQELQPEEQHQDGKIQSHSAELDWGNQLAQGLDRGVGDHEDRLSHQGEPTLRAPVSRK